jgi:hypothetical protein
MQRPVFQDGRILRTSDFVDEQTFHLTENRRHNRTNHIWGIASGLGVVQLDGDLVVKSGCAVDGFGRRVVLEAASYLDLRGFDIRGVEAVDVWVVYARTRVAGTGDRVDRLVDSAAVEVTDADDTLDPRQPPGVTPADLVAAASQPAPDDPARRWPVYLGTITRDLAHPENAPRIELDRRPYIGLVGATVATPAPRPFTWLEYTDAPDPTVSVNLPGSPGTPGNPGTPDTTPLKVSRTGGVELNDQLTVDGELVVRGGSLTVAPVTPALPAPASGPPEWSLSHAEDAIAHELRVAMPAAGSGTVPNRLVVGVWRDGSFARSLVVDETGTVMIAGNLVVSGYLRASSVQQAQLSAEAAAYLAGLHATSLLTLFQLVSTTVIN